MNLNDILKYADRKLLFAVFAGVLIAAASYFLLFQRFEADQLDAEMELRAVEREHQELVAQISGLREKGITQAPELSRRIQLIEQAFPEDVTDTDSRLVLSAIMQDIYNTSNVELGSDGLVLSPSSGNALEIGIFTGIPYSLNVSGSSSAVVAFLDELQTRTGLLITYRNISISSSDDFVPGGNISVAATAYIWTSSTEPLVGQPLVLNRAYIDRVVSGIPAPAPQENNSEETNQEEEPVEEQEPEEEEGFEEQDPEEEPLEEEAAEPPPPN